MAGGEYRVWKYANARRKYKKYKAASSSQPGGDTMFFSKHVPLQARSP
jgi:hypothetical protein